MSDKKKTTRRLNRIEQSDLDLEIAFMEGIVKRDPRIVEAWFALSQDYARRGKLECRIKAPEELAKLCPNDPHVLYDLACCYSLVRDTERGIPTLMRAIGRGFNDVKWLLKDPDLRNIRKDGGFREVWKKLSEVR